MHGDADDLKAQVDDLAEDIVSLYPKLGVLNRPLAGEPGPLRSGDGPSYYVPGVLFSESNIVSQCLLKNPGPCALFLLLGC